MVLLRGIIAALAAALAVPAVASAGTASVLRETLRYEAPAGETNTVAILNAGASVRIIDTGAPIAAGPGCTAISASTVECSGGDLTKLVVNAGDGDDEVVNSTILVGVIRGGDGEDRLIGGFVGDELHGGHGDDELVAFFGDDLLDGGPGADDLHGDPPDPEGTGGLDFVSYKFRTNGVTVTNDDVANDGEPGEGDNVHSDVEVLQGGQGDDHLTFTDGFFAGILGGPGDDVANAAPGRPEFAIVLGQGGNDVLRGGPGESVIAGGRGNDVVRAGRGNDSAWGDQGADLVLGQAGNDELWGGLGRDRVAGGDGRDRLAAKDGERDELFGGPDRDRAFLDSRLDLALGIERFPAGDTPRRARPSARPGALRALARSFFR